MDDRNGVTGRPLLPATRWLLRLFVVLTLLGFAALGVMSEATERYFAWTIDPPLTAAFLGAGYAAGFLLIVLTLRLRTWARARVPTITVAVFTALTLLATVVHRGLFHFAQPGLPGFAAWFWTAVYVTIPVALVVLIRMQEQAPGQDEPKLVPMPRRMAYVVGAQGALLLAVGAAMYLAPSTSSVLWPWDLAPLGARAVAAWVIAFGFAAVLSLREDDLARLDTSALAYAAFGLLQLVMLARYPQVVQWAEPSGWVYVLMLSSMVVVGAYGWWMARQTRSATAPGPSAPAAAP